METRTSRPLPALHTPEWYEARHGTMGASDISAALGLNKYRSPFALYVEKTSPPEPSTAGEAAYWGNALEDVVATEYAKRFDREPFKPTDTIVVDGWASANPDRVFAKQNGSLELLEVKTGSSYIWGAESEQSPIPLVYRLQAMWQAWVWEADIVRFAVLIDGRNFHPTDETEIDLYSVRRDDEAIEFLVRRGREFMDMVESKTPPKVLDDPTESTRDALAKAFPADLQAESIELDFAGQALVSTYQKARADAKAAKEFVDATANQLRAYMGEATDARMPGANKSAVTWRPTKRFDAESFAISRPDLAAEFAKGIDLKALRKTHPSIAAEFEHVDLHKRTLRVSD